MIIDAHMHLGEDLIFNSNDDENDILNYMNAHGFDGVLLQPGLYVNDVQKAHQRIRAFAGAHPGKAWGLAAFSVNMPEDAYFALAQWAVQELGFKGLKLHPYAFCAAPNSPQAQKVFKAAQKLNVPVMIHTGPGLPVSLPSLCIPAANAYPELTVVLAHAGGGMFGADALAAAEVCPNIVLETSWAHVQDIKLFVEKLGTRRVMIGTDIPLNAGVERAKYAALGLNEEELAWCLGKTAQNVFKLF